MDTDTTPNTTAEQAAPAPDVTPATPEIPRTKEAILAALSALPQSDTPEAGASSQPESVTTNATEEEATPPEAPERDTAGDEPSDAGEEGVEGDGDSGDDQPEGKQTSKNFRGRWDHLDDTERRIVELTTKRGLSLQEAMRRVYGTDSASDSGSEAPAEAKPDPVAQVEEQLSAKQAELDALEESMDGGGFDRDAKADRKRQRELTIELAELRAEKRVVQRQQEREAAEASSLNATRWENAVAASFDDVRTAYPDIISQNTELAQSFSEEMAYLHASNDPILSKSNFPILIARRIARQLGIRPATATASQESASAPPAQPHTPAVAPAPKAGGQAQKIRPVPAGGSPVAPPTLEQQIAQATTKEQMLELMKVHGTPLVRR